MTDPQLPPPFGAVAPPPPVYPAAPAPQAAPAAAPQVAPAPAPQAPPGAYQVPVGGYAAPQGGYMAPVAPTAPSNGFLGILSLVVAGIAAVVIPIIGGIAGFEIGIRIPGGIDPSAPDVLSTLTPARTQVLWTEVAFWTGTALGIAAIVIGIFAIRRKARRALGIAGIVLAVLGAGIFWAVLVATVIAGTATGIVNY